MMAILLFANMKIFCIWFQINWTKSQSDIETPMSSFKIPIDIGLIQWIEYYYRYMLKLNCYDPKNRQIMLVIIIIIKFQSHCQITVWLKPNDCRACLYLSVTWCYALIWRIITRDKQSKLEDTSEQTIQAFQQCSITL